MNCTTFCVGWFKTWLNDLNFLPYNNKISFSFPVHKNNLLICPWLIFLSSDNTTVIFTHEVLWCKVKRVKQKEMLTSYPFSSTRHGLSVTNMTIFHSLNELQDLCCQQCWSDYHMSVLHWLFRFCVLKIVLMWQCTAQCSFSCMTFCAHPVKQ